MQEGELVRGCVGKGNVSLVQEYVYRWRCWMREGNRIGVYECYGVSGMFSMFL